MPRNDIQKQGRILMLPVDCIEPSPYQARTAFDEPEIAALAVSILQNGLLQPISVRRVGLHKYQLVAGERRLRACRLAKLDKVPAILADYDDSESAALGLLEKWQRSQLGPVRHGAGHQGGHPPVGLHPGRGRAAAGVEPARPCQQAAPADPDAGTAAGSARPAI